MKEGKVRIKRAGYGGKLEMEPGTQKEVHYMEGK